MAHKWKKHLPSDVNSFRRARGSKPPAKAILILTEGEVTEPVYFQALKAKLALPTVEIEVQPKGKGDPARLAEAALEERLKRRKSARQGRLSYAQAADFDEMWVVFDSDVPLEHGRFHSGVEFAESKGVKCAHTTPCFEYWLLLHLIYTTAPMEKFEDVKPRLSKAMAIKYDKCSKDSAKHLPPLVDKLNTAIELAERVRKSHESAGTAFPANPSTEVDQLVLAIQAAASPANK